MAMRFHAGAFNTLAKARPLASKRTHTPPGWIAARGFDVCGAAERIAGTMGGFAILFTRPTSLILFVLMVLFDPSLLFRRLWSGKAASA